MARWSKLISAAARHAGELAEKSAEWLRHVADAKDGVGAAPAPGAPPTPAPWMIEHAMSMAEQRGVYDQLDPWSREVYEETIKSGKAWSRLTSADPAKVDLYRADGEDVNMLADPGAATGPTARPAKYDESGRPIRGEKDPKAVFTDPYAMAQQMGYRERPRWLPDSAIDTLLMRCPPLGAVIQTQVANVAKYAVPSQFNFEQGFRIRMKDRLSHPTPADRKEIERITQIIQHSGSVNNGRPRPNFEGFLRAYTRDSLKYDAGAFEILHNRRGKPVEWLPVDGKMIRFAETGATFPVADRDAIYTVGVIESMIVAKWKRKNLSFEPRNVTADIRMMGYGVPEFESMINMVTALLAALTYNRNFFLQGVNARGVLALMGDMPEKQLKDFRNEWYSMLAGSDMAWRTPVINTQDVKWIPMQTSNRDMEFTAWVDFLIKTCCAFYQMDPIEINFKFGNQGGRSMFEGASRAKVQESRERGLKPLLRFIAANLNRHIVEPINSDFELMFTGTDMQSPKELADLYTQQARSFMTVNEVRAQQDLPAFRPELGDVILDANWMNAYSSVRVDEREAEEREAEAEQMRELELEQEQQADMVRDAVVGEGGPTALEHLLHQLTSGEKIGPDVTGHGRGAVTPLATGRGSIPTGKPPESTTSLARVRAESRGSYVEGDTGATEVGELSRGWRPSARKSGSQPREAPAVGGEAETTIVIDV